MATPVASLGGSNERYAGGGRAVSPAGEARRDAPLDSEGKVIQLVSRITFGPRPGDLERVRDLGLKTFLDQQLHPERLEDSAVETRLANLPTLSMTTSELIRKYPAPNQLQLQQTRMLAESAGQPAAGASAATMAPSMEAMAAARASDTSFEVLTELGQEGLLRAIYSERQLNEVMVRFWMNHFNIFAQKGPDKWMLTSFERDTIRPHALGKFEDLLVATAQSPAMLFYLDNWMSSAPGSNPAPPLLGRREAFGGWRRFGGAFMPAGFLGGPNEPGFLKAAGPNGQKRGLNENYGRELMELHTLGVDGGYTQHDVTELARCLTGWTVRRPREEAEFFFNPRVHDEGPKTLLGHKITAGGIDDGRQALHILATHPSTSRFISTKLCRRFVADDPPGSLVDLTSQEFARTNGDVRSVLKTILTSPEFYSEAAYRAKVKSPFEMVASTLRALGAETEAARPLFGLMARMGEPPFQYQAPAGYADQASTWISSSSLLARLNFASSIVSNGIPGTQVNLGTTAGNGSPGSVVDDLSRRLTGGTLSHSSRQAILSSLQSIHGPGASAPEGPPTDESESFATAATIAALVIGSPEFQMR
ncbi:MAG TPA: DUF1800 domain-containing protein [Terriglobia bacterium]|nr:DUF1800 domain-containing protein [Terriglobia bacterium]